MRVAPRLEHCMFTSNQTAVTAESGSVVRKAFRVVAPPTGTELLDSIDWLEEWNGPVIATAAAVGALVLSEQHGGVLGAIDQPTHLDCAYQGDLSELIVGSMHWLARRQHRDGGWASYTDNLDDPSQLMTSMMVRSAFRLIGAPAAYPELGDWMSAFIKNRGGVEQLKTKYGALHSATLLTRGTSALAEVIDWKQLPAIPIERMDFNSKVNRAEFWADRESVTPAIVALGIAAFERNKPLNPWTRWRRARASRRAMDWLARVQWDNGSFANSVPVTSMVLMSLASIRKTASPIVRRGVAYLFDEVRGDGSWPGKLS